MWVIFQKGTTEYNDLHFISIIATPLFRIAQSKLKHPIFPKPQQFIGTNGKIYKRVLELFLYLQVYQNEQPVYVCIGQPTGWELCTRY